MVVPLMVAWQTMVAPPPAGPDHVPAPPGCIVPDQPVHGTMASMVQFLCTNVRVLLTADGLHEWAVITQVPASDGQIPVPPASPPQPTTGSVEGE